MTDTEFVYRKCQYENFDYPKAEVDVVIAQYIVEGVIADKKACLQEIVRDMMAWAGADTKIGSMTIGIQSNLEQIHFNIEAL